MQTVPTGMFPSLVFTGSRDAITPAHKHALSIYESLNSKSKIYISITGGNQTKMALITGRREEAKRTWPQDKISRAEQHGILIRYIIPWLECHLKGRESECTNFDIMLEADTTITFRKKSVLD